MTDAPHPLSPSDFAAMLHVSVRTVHRWIAAGMPSELLYRRTRRIPVARAMARLTARAELAKARPRPTEARALQ